jgi:hypothetical protein
MCFACTLALGLSSALAQQDDWPRTLPVGEGLVTIYPLQAEQMVGETVHYRAALAYRPAPDADPVFGAGWFESKVEIDSEDGVVHASDLRVTQTRFPEGTAEVRDPLADALAAFSPRWNLDFPLDRLESDLQTAAAESESLENLNTAPPRIVYRDRPALLVTLDGDPLLREIEDSPYRAVINTPYPMISDGRHFYLNVSKDVWYRSDRATGPFRFVASPPAGIAALVKPEAEQSAAAPSAAITAANAPEIVIATSPTELIVTDGPAVFVPLVDDLLVLQNSDDDVFMHVESQQFYVVLAGRWYHADTLNGPWSYRAADQLPPAFAEIPRQSDQADARVHVAGTEEAREAVLEAQVPQTAAVERGVAEVEVSYDGQPDFRPVEGTDMEYAVNTGAAVLHSDRQYYLVDDGVWYVSDSPNGPWRVSAWRPQAVGSIAPTSPVYHVKYVYIYDSTPDVVYVGYTPGYLGNYVYHGTVVYGTGWYYRPWVSPYYYYPRPSTWGFHVSYNPWSGWGFGLSWNWGWGWDPFYTSYWSGGYWHHQHHWHHRHYGYWGPRGYRPHRASRPGQHRYGNDPYGDQRYGHRRGERHDGGRTGRGDSLYRNPAQGARFADSNDLYRPPRSTRGTGGRSASAPDNRSWRNLQRGVEAAQARNRNSRIRASDLRLKAEVLDVHREATRSLMVTDRNAKVRHKTKPAPQPRLQTAPGRRASASDKATRQARSAPAPVLRDARQIAGQQNRGIRRPNPDSRREDFAASVQRFRPAPVPSQREPRQARAHSAPAKRPSASPPPGERRERSAEAAERRRTAAPAPAPRASGPAPERQAAGPRGKSGRAAERRSQRQN